jgi:hypothetical protein
MTSCNAEVGHTGTKGERHFLTVVRDINVPLQYVPRILLLDDVLQGVARMCEGGLPCLDQYTTDDPNTSGHKAFSQLEKRSRTHAYTDHQLILLV